jgi:hypothetical protein
LPSYDFAVDLKALVEAAQGTAEAIQLMRDKDVEDFVPPEQACGSAVVWEAVAEFKDRWERGLNDMVRDVEEVSGRLGKVAMNYAEFDRTGHDALVAAVPHLAPLTIGPAT